jgi:hypothetical protein
LQVDFFAQKNRFGPWPEAACWSPGDLGWLELAAPVTGYGDGEAGVELGLGIDHKDKCLRCVTAAFACVGCFAVPVFACRTDFVFGTGVGLAHDVRWLDFRANETPVSEVDQLALWVAVNCYCNAISTKGFPMTTGTAYRSGAFKIVMNRAGGLKPPLRMMAARRQPLHKKPGGVTPPGL